jgi:uncharacterized protein YccT (UPF0319 family)
LKFFARYLMSTLLLSLSALSHADVVLRLGDGVVVTAIDGKELSLGLFSPRQTRYVLPAGEHVIAARFERLYDISADDHDVVKSGSVQISTPALIDEQAYQLDLVGGPTTHHQAIQYAKSPTLRLNNAQGQVLVEVSGQQNQGASLLTGINRALGQLNPVAEPSIEPPTVMTTFKTLWQTASSDERQAIAKYAKVHLND